jgi:hypothetical protein
MKQPTIRITTAELRRAFDAHMQDLEATGLAVIEVNTDGYDSYWHVMPDQRHQDCPGELGLGLLSDDWQYVECIAAGTGEPISYGLIWLASILQAVGLAASTPGLTSAE